MLTPRTVIASREVSFGGRGSKLTCILRIALSYAAEKRCGLCDYEARLKQVEVPDASCREPGTGKCNMSVVVRWKCWLGRVFVNLHAASNFMLRQSSCRSQRLTRTHAQPLFWVRSNALATKQHGKQQNEFTHIGEGCSQCWPAFDVAAPLANAAEMVDDVWFRNPNQFLAERSADPPVQLMGVAQSYGEASDAHLPIQQCHPNGSAAGLCRLRDESGLSLAVPER